MFNLSWSRECSLPEKITSLVVQDQGSRGYLSFRNNTDPEVKHAIPGTSWNYQCNDGFGLPDRTNPVQQLQCKATGTLFFDKELCQCKLISRYFLSIEY